MKFIRTTKRSTLKLAKLQNLVAKCCKMRKLYSVKFANFVYFRITRGKNTFDGKIIKTFARNTNIQGVPKKAEC